MILDDIVEKTKVRLEKSKSHIDEETMRKNALSSPLPKASFKDALAKEELSFILEVKKGTKKRTPATPFTTRTMQQEMAYTYDLVTKVDSAVLLPSITYHYLRRSGSLSHIRRI